MNELRYLDRPPLINGEPLPREISWSEDSEVVESTGETEAGTTNRIVTRYDKLTISVSGTASDRWLARYMAWSKQPTLTVQHWDPEEQDYKTRTMCLRGLKKKLNTESWKTYESMGIWDVSFSLEEF